MNNKKTLLAILCLVALTMLVSAIGSIISPIAKQDQTAAMAGMPSDAQKLTGWAWSSNIGWISFDGTGYGVYKNPDGTLHGYAWANPADTTDPANPTNNIGWIKFDPASDYPEAPNHGAQIEASGAVTGWARACVAAPNPATCSGVGSNPDAGGWDGWIKLSGTWANGVSKSGNNLTGFAWGSEVVGWVSFDGVTIEDSAALTVTCFPDDTSVAPNENFNWIATNPTPAGITPYTYTWSGSVSGSGQSLPTSYPSIGTYSASVKVTDSTSPTPLSSSITSCTSSVYVTDCPAGQHGTLPNCLCNGTDLPPVDGLCSGTGTGALVVFAGDEVINISEQASGLPATTIVKVTRPGAQITNTGNAAVTGLHVESITSTKVGGGALITPYLCSFNSTMATNDDTFSSCNNLGTLDPISSEPNGKYLRLRIPAYLQAIAGNSPYKVKIAGTTSVTAGDPPVTTDQPVSATLLFQYLVGTYTPQ